MPKKKHSKKKAPTEENKTKIETTEKQIEIVEKEPKEEIIEKQEIKLDEEDNEEKQEIKLEKQEEKEETDEKQEEKKEFAGDKFMSKLNDLDYLRKKQFYEDMHKECKMEDLYKDLEDIENINKKLTPINKINTIRSNFSVDYNRLLNKGKKIKLYKF